MLVGQGGRVLIQATYFVIVARFLGVDGFGAFAVATALVALLGPLASIGALNLMIRNIVRESESAPCQYATALAVSFLSAILVTAALLALRAQIAPPELTAWALMCICAADLFGSRAAELAASVYVAMEQMRHTALIHLSMQGARALGAVILAVAPAAFTLTNWATVYAAATLLPATAITVLVGRRVGLARPDWSGFRRDWRQGVMFSISLSSQSVYNDIDKAMLGRLATVEAAGFYTAAYRVIDMAFIPVGALLGAAYPKFFREGQHGIARATMLIHRLLPPGVAYCMLAGAGLVAFADLVPVILGQDYTGAVDALRALAVIPLFKLLHYLPSNALTGAGMQGARSVAQGAAAGANVALNVVLIPAYGYWGAVVASVLTDGALVVMVWSILLVRVRRERRQAAAGARPPMHMRDP